MTRDDVIKTYLPNFNLYIHLLSIDEQMDVFKKFKAYMRKEDSIDNKKARYNCIKKPRLSKKVYLQITITDIIIIFLFHINFFKFNNGK